MLGLARANKSYLVALNLTVGARAAKEKNIKRKEVKKLNLENLGDYILMSALNENDICILEEKIIEMYKIGNISEIDATYISNSRQIGKLHEAMNSINDALEGVYSGQVVDMINIDISMAWKALGDIVGANASDSLINELFSKFCLGK